MTWFAQSWSSSCTKYGKALWNKVLICDSLYDDYVLRGILFKDCWNWSAMLIVHIWARKEGYSTLLGVPCDFVNQIRIRSRNTYLRSHSEKTEIWSWNIRHRGGNANNTYLTSYSSISSAHQNASSSRSRSPPKAMLIWHQKSRRSPQSFSPVLSATLVDNAIQLFLIGWQPSNDAISAISHELLATLITACKTDLLSISRCPILYPSNSYCKRSPTK